MLQEYLEEHLKQIPLQRYGRIDEIASASTFLFSPAAAYITGTTLVVDGADVSLLFQSTLARISKTDPRRVHVWTVSHVGGFAGAARDEGRRGQLAQGRLEAVDPLLCNVAEIVLTWTQASLVNNISFN